MTEPIHVADALLAAIETEGSPVCVGIDPNPAKMPEAFQPADVPPLQRVDELRQWCLGVLEVVAPHVPAVKPQIAYFEQYATPDEPFAGMKVYAEVVRAARELGLVVIGDAKRGDIGSTASAYAAAHLSTPDSVDWLTVNSYFGVDGLTPFLATGAETGRGAFALVRTSNPSAASVQDFADASGKPFYRHLAERIDEIGQDYVGASGYSALGAVVGATWPQEARELREVMPRQIFLVPGYGAQGGTAADCAASFKSDGTGAIVNASRSVIYAHAREEYAGMDWKNAVAAAAKAFADDIAGAVK